MENVDSNKYILKLIVLYVGIYLLSYAVTTLLWFIAHTHLRYYAPVLITAAYVATRFIRDNSRAMTPSEKIKIISGTFAGTLIVNILFAVNIANAVRSADHLDGDFLVRQILYLFGLCLLFGSDYFYSYLKKQNK